MIYVWKIIFLVFGLLTICLGVLFYFVVPENQLKAQWLSPQDRIFALQRIRGNNQGIGGKQWKMYQFREALLDPLTWMYFLMAVLVSYALSI